MVLLIISTLASTIICALLIRYRDWHLSLSGDHVGVGPQKIHQELIPRIGGIGIVSGFIVAVIVSGLINPIVTKPLSLIGLSALPIFLAGISEDLTKRISVKIRLNSAFISGMTFLYLFEINHIRLDIPFIDTLMHFSIISVLFLAFAIAGLSNAYNIIDGFNGLASMVAVISATAILYVAFKVQDQLVISLVFITIGSIIGFFIWNYPKGLIFLGDGGAYLIGFFLSIASILLVVRNPVVSPWFALMVNAYPIFETVFSIWRRAIHKGRSPSIPDGAHFHSLIYRRIMRWVQHNSKENYYLRNAKTSPYLWFLSSMGVIPAILWWKTTNILIVASLVFILFYIYLYFRIVNFKTPDFLKIERIFKK